MGPFSWAGRMTEATTAPLGGNHSIVTSTHARSGPVNTAISRVQMRIRPDSCREEVADRVLIIGVAI
jgi:hypothetical protein